jgi:hypothetical protein
VSLSLGIVGLPNVGKSTLFNALLKKQQALAANYPFATIEPNVGIVPVPDQRLGVLADIVKTGKIVPATVKFVDIAGLIKGASQGEGLGNKFLSHVRETDAIVYVLRAFSDPDVIKQGVEDPKTDFEVLKMELDLSDIEMTENHMKKKNAEPEELPLFSKKPSLVVLNIDESEIVKSSEIEKTYSTILGIENTRVIAVCAKTESELSELSDEEQKEYLHDLGTEMSALDKLIKKSFLTLGLTSFLTAGELEARAWTIRDGMTAVEASGVIHSDFMKKFIKAEIVSYDDFVSLNGWKGARDAGKARQEGRDYVMKDGDVVEFKIGA